MIRPATIDDSAGIADAHVSSWRTTYLGIIPQEVLDGLSVEKRTVSWREIFLQGEGMTFVVDNSSTIEGFSSIGPTRDTDKDPTTTSELYSLYLKSAAQRGGNGRKLFDAGTAWAKAQGFVEMTALVLEENTQARRFYERMGMTLDGGTKLSAIQGRIFSKYAISCR